MGAAAPSLTRRALGAPAREASDRPCGSALAGAMTSVGWLAGCNEFLVCVVDTARAAMGGRLRIRDLAGIELRPMSGDRPL